MQNSTELQKVRKNLDTWLTAFNAHDLETLFSLYDPESIYANAGAPLMQGIDEIEQWYAEAFQSIEGTLLHQEEAAFIDGNIAMLLGAYYFRPPEGVTPPDGAHLTGRVSLVYRRNASGEWKLLFDMDNTPPDITPDAFA
jgi:ketosteroid isomerase-like protein